MATPGSPDGTGSHVAGTPADGIRPSTGAPPAGRDGGAAPASPDANGAPAVKASDAKTIRDMGWWELFLRGMPRDYAIGYLAVTVVAIFGLIVKSRRLRYASLAFSVIFLGFLVGLRLSGLGGPSTLILIALRQKCGKPILPLHLLQAVS